MNKTKIEWAKNPDGSQGYTWNPITGCLNGCEYCYARRLANGRLKSRYLANEQVALLDLETFRKFHFHNQKVLAREDPFYPRFWEDRLTEMELYTGVGKGIFVCDMSDLFGIGIPEQWTRRVIRDIEMNRRNRFYLLTKQPQNLLKFSPFPDNCWVGVSATNMTMTIQALLRLSQVEARVKYISFEPLLSPTYLVSEDLLVGDIAWVIIGSQTKPDKPPEVEWVEGIVKACDKAGIPVFLKDNLKPLIQEIGMSQASWAAREWVQCKYPILRQEMPDVKTIH